MKSKVNRGFTMIELLIVIAVLGILAIAVLATFNPIEQINRGRDTSSRSDSEQLLSAIDRYNANRGLWPWQDSADDSDSAPVNNGGNMVEITTDSPQSPLACSLMEQLSTTTEVDCTGTEEIKEAFANRVTSGTANALHIYKGDQSADSVYICFNPQSKAFITEADQRCNGTPPDDFPGDACGACPESLGDNANCICLP